jgi:hypothetical protein
VIKISAVPVDLVNQYWGHVLPILSKAFNYASMKISEQDVYTDIMNGDQTLWVAFDGTPLNLVGAFTVRVKNYPAGKALCGEHLGGERLNEWADELFDTMESYANHLGINRLELIGRRGWEKLLRSKGWKANTIVYEKEI